jgi:hypothetical protein
MSKESSPDQRNYSVDEMMDRLRDGEREKRNQPQSEMVTRPDGTQVVRVRKRKRRSRQPKAEAAKATKLQRKWLVVLGAVGIACLLVLAVAMLLLLAKYNSKGFQNGLEERINGNVGAETAIKGLSVTPLRARARTVSLDWGDGSFLDSLTLNSVTADTGIMSLLGADWSGEEVLAANGHLKVTQPAPRGPEGPGAIPSSAKPFGFIQYQCSFLTIEFGDRKVDGALLKNTELSLRNPAKGAGQVLLRGGTLDAAGWPPMDVDRGTALVSNGALDLISFRATPKIGGGEVTFKSVEPIEAGRGAVLAVALADFPLSNLAGTGMEAIVGGVISSDNGSIQLKDGPLAAAEIRVEFEGSDGYLKGFPFLDNLRSIFGDTDYAQPVFESIRGVYRRGPAGTELQNLEFAHREQMLVRGTIAVATDGELSGRLEVGIPEGRAITATGRKRSAIFSSPEGGFCWVSIDLDGTIQDPGDNFKVLLQRSAHESSRRKNSKDPGESRFDELTR